jgi:hypothetical protein
MDAMEAMETMETMRKGVEFHRIHLRGARRIPEKPAPPSQAVGPLPAG